MFEAIDEFDLDEHRRREREGMRAHAELRAKFAELRELRVELSRDAYIVDRLIQIYDGRPPAPRVEQPQRVMLGIELGPSRSKYLPRAKDMLRGAGPCIVTGKGAKQILRTMIDLGTPEGQALALEVLQLVYRSKSVRVEVNGESKNTFHVVNRLECALAKDSPFHCFRAVGLRNVTYEKDGYGVPCQEVTSFVKRKFNLSDSKDDFRDAVIVSFYDAMMLRDGALVFDPDQFRNEVLSRIVELDALWCPGFSMEELEEKLYALPPIGVEADEVARVEALALVNEGDADATKSDLVPIPDLDEETTRTVLRVLLDDE